MHHCQCNKNLTLNIICKRSLHVQLQVYTIMLKSMNNCTLYNVTYLKPRTSTPCKHIQRPQAFEAGSPWFYSLLHCWTRTLSLTLSFALTLKLNSDNLEIKTIQTVITDVFFQWTLFFVFSWFEQDCRNARMNGAYYLFTRKNKELFMNLQIC